MEFTYTQNSIADAVNTYSDTVFRIAWQYVGNRADAEDVVQDVFLKLLNKRPALQGDKLKAWLIRVTINACKDFLRAAKRRREALSRTFFAELPPDTAYVFEELSNLPAKDRDALYLHYYEGYTAREIADIVGDSERAVTKRIGRAREKLKKLLEEEQ